MASSKFLYFLLFSQLFLMSSFTFFATSIRLQYYTVKHNNGTTEDLISTTCKHTLYYEICISSLKSDPRCETADIQGLASIALNVSISYGEETLSHIADLKSKAKENNSTDHLSSCLSDCVEEYNDAVENLEEAVKALKVKSVEDVKTFVSTAMTDSDTCEEGFEEMEMGGNDQSPLSDRNQYFSKLCSNCLAISSLLS